MQEFVFLEIKPVFPVCIRQILVYFRVLYFPFCYQIYTSL